MSHVNPCECYPLAPPYHQDQIGDLQCHSNVSMETLLRPQQKFRGSPWAKETQVFTLFFKGNMTPCWFPYFFKWLAQPPPSLTCFHWLVNGKDMRMAESHFCSHYLYNHSFTPLLSIVRCSNIYQPIHGEDINIYKPFIYSHLIYSTCKEKVVPFFTSNKNQQRPTDNGQLFVKPYISLRNVPFRKHEDTPQKSNM